MNKLDEERKNKNIEKENERFTIETHIFNEKYINKAGNISDEVYQTKYVALDGVAVTNDYMYLKRIDTDTFIFANLIVDSKDYDLACKEDFIGNIVAKKKYGILKLKRRLFVGELVIDKLKEEIIVPAVYDKIEHNKDKVVTVYGNNSKSYFDYERKAYLSPLMLEETGKNIKTEDKPKKITGEERKCLKKFETAITNYENNLEAAMELDNLCKRDRYVEDNMCIDPTISFHK